MEQNWEEEPRTKNNTDAIHELIATLFCFFSSFVMLPTSLKETWQPELLITTFTAENATQFFGGFTYWIEMYHVKFRQQKCPFFKKILRRK